MKKIITLLTLVFLLGAAVNFSMVSNAKKIDIIEKESNQDTVILDVYVEYLKEESEDLKVYAGLEGAKIELKNLDTGEKIEGVTDIYGHRFFEFERYTTVKMLKISADNYRTEYLLAYLPLELEGDMLTINFILDPKPKNINLDNSNFLINSLLNFRFLFKNLLINY